MPKVQRGEVKDGFMRHGAEMFLIYTSVWAFAVFASEYWIIDKRNDQETHSVGDKV